MLVDLAFFDGDVLLARAVIRCGSKETTESITGEGHEFHVTHRYEEPACPIEIVCTKAGVRLYSAALRMGVHTSQDWESVNLGNIHDLGFFCRPSEAGEAQP
jgi:hypothetical protein